MIYDNTTVPSRYEEARKFTSGTSEKWRTALLNNLEKHSINSIVDLGSGTGRFTTLLADTFSAKVIGVEPSADMRSQAEAKNDLETIQFREGQAEDIPCDSNSADLLFMSMVFHHLSDRNRAFHEIKRVVRKGGFFCIRNYTREALPELPYLKYFPTALDVDENNLPTRSELQELGKRAGFTPMAQVVVVQEAANSKRAYFEKIAKRAYSDLASISDADFSTGLNRMKNEEDLADSSPVMEPVDLFTFQN